MDRKEMARRRLRAQHLVGPPPADPVEVVRHFGAVQAQEYAYALWGLAQRTDGVPATAVRKLVDDGAIVRTHALRPTWHFLAPEDLGWIQALTGPRVHAFNAYYYRKHGFDEASAERASTTIVDALRGHRYLTRNELGAVLGDSGNRLAYLIMLAELSGLVVNGPMNGKQHTYGLAAERTSQPRELTGDDALAELIRRYFTGHGPATAKDFAWWSSLTMARIKQGLALVGDELGHAEVDGLQVWFDPAIDDGSIPATVFLLQAFDEYVVAYGNTKFVHNPNPIEPEPGGRFTEHMMMHPVVADGIVSGYWRRKTGTLEIHLIKELNTKQTKALATELARFEAHTETALSVTYI
jgi:hypothetical protein